MEDAFDYVVNEVAKIALKKLNMDENDSGNVFLMGHILVGLCGSDSDEIIAARSLGYLMMSGRYLQEEEVKKMVAETREKCGMQVLGLQMAYNSIEEFSCSGIEALAQIHQFL